MQQLDITVLVPAFNEEDYIEETIKAVSSWQIDKEIIVINDGSTDNTLSILNELQKKIDIFIINLQENQGKGQALMQGIKEAKGKIISFIDADLGISAGNAIELVFPVLYEEADMTIAILPAKKKKAGFGFVKELARLGILTLSGYETLAPLSGQRAIRKEILQEIKLADGFGIEVGLTIDIIRKGFRIKEIEIELTHRETGNDLNGYIHRGKEFFEVLIALLTKWRQKAS